jgi:hypothetical protein
MDHWIYEYECPICDRKKCRHQREAIEGLQTLKYRDTPSEHPGAPEARDLEPVRRRSMITGNLDERQPEIRKRGWFDRLRGR